MPITKESFQALTKNAREWGKAFDAAVKGKEYLVGDKISVADITVASYIHWLLRLSYDEKFRSQIPNLLQWYEKISALPAFKNALGKTWYAKKEFEPVCFVEEASTASPAPKHDKGEKPEKAEKKEKGEKVEKADKGEKADKTKTDKPKTEKPKPE